MLTSGVQTFVCEGIRAIAVSTICDFNVIAYKDGAEFCILGPQYQNSRQASIEIDPSWDEVTITPSTDDLYSVTCMIDNSQEHPDQTPVEIGIDTQKPPSLREEVQKYVAEAFSELHQEEETMKDADDFDIPEADEYQSPYELTEMQEEFLLEPNTEETTSPVDPKPGNSANPEDSNGQGEDKSDSKEEPPAKVEEGG